MNTQLNGPMTMIVGTIHPTLMATLWKLTVLEAKRLHAETARKAAVLKDLVLDLGLIVLPVDDAEDFVAMTLGALRHEAARFARENSLRRVSFTRNGLRLVIDTERPASPVYVERWVCCDVCSGYGRVIVPTAERWVEKAMALPVGHYPLKDERVCWKPTCRGVGGWWRNVTTLR